jgi:hypothetical protein
LAEDKISELPIVLQTSFVSVKFVPSKINCRTAFGQKLFLTVAAGKNEIIVVELKLC